jgi:transcription elongation factor GreA
VAVRGEPASSATDFLRAGARGVPKWLFQPIVGRGADGESEKTMFLENGSIWPVENGRRPESRAAASMLPPVDELPVTAAAHQALRQELVKLRQEKAQFADQLRLVREFGGTANNYEHLAIREEEAVVDARLARLEDIIDRARIVGAAESADTIALGSSVTVLDRGVGEPYDYVIDSAHAPVARNAVSAVSPVGKALLGRKAGEVVTVQLPRKGRTRELEIVAVRPLETP